MAQVKPNFKVTNLEVKIAVFWDPNLRTWTAKLVDLTKYQKLETICHTVIYEGDPAKNFLRELALKPDHEEFPEDNAQFLFSKSKNRVFKKQVSMENQNENQQFKVSDHSKHIFRFLL